MATNNDEQTNIFNSFCKSCVHNGKYYELKKEFTGKTHAVVKYQITNADGELLEEDTFHKESGTGEHAEQKVIRKLKTKLTNYREQKKSPAKMIVEIRISFSPCSGCSNKIMEFKEQGENPTEVEMTVVIANLYSVRRPSCMNSCNGDTLCIGHIQYDFITVESDSTLQQRTEEKTRLTQIGKSTVTLQQAIANEQKSKDNVMGLKHMKEKGITIRTFCPGDWGFLLDFLFLRGPETEEGRKLKEQGLMAVEARKLEDVRMGRDLTDLLSEDGWREATTNEADATAVATEAVAERRGRAR